MLNDQKTYCADHLKKEEAQNAKVTILVRKPNEDRKYILSMFGKICIEEEEEDG